jgi:hypothetical protein
VISKKKLANNLHIACALQNMDKNIIAPPHPNLLPPREKELLSTPLTRGIEGVLFSTFLSSTKLFSNNKHNVC